jgi:predicted transcriptional regulator
VVDPLDDAAYLTRSENRVTVMQLLREEPRDRDDLKRATGVSRVTIGRMVGELEDRGWVRREGHEYHLTHAGRLVVEDLSRFVRTTATARKLREIEPLLPVDAFDFDLRRFADAAVHRPTRSDPNAHMRRMAELFATADRARVLAPSVSPVPVRAHRERVRESEEHDGTIVFTEAAAAVATGDESVRSWFREMADTDRVEFYRHDGSAPLDVVVVDETVMLTVYHEDSAGFHSVVETTSDPVLAWALAEIDRYAAEAERMDPEQFA